MRGLSRSRIGTFSQMPRSRIRSSRLRGARRRPLRHKTACASIVMWAATGSTGWDRSTRYRDLGCSDCHNPMTRTSRTGLLREASVNEACFTCHKTQRLQFRKRSHMPLLEGKMTCVDCHNPHGSATDPLLRADSVNQLCFGCHAEEARPVSVGTRPGHRELPELSFTARIKPRESTSDCAALPVPTVSRANRGIGSSDCAPDPRQSRQWGPAGRAADQPRLCQLPRPESTVPTIHPGHASIAEVNDD